MKQDSYYMDETLKKNLSDLKEHLIQSQDIIIILDGEERNSRSSKEAIRYKEKNSR